MNVNSLRQYVLQAALELSELTDATPTPGERGLEFGINGVLDHEGEKVRLQICIATDFPESKPEFYFLNAKGFPRIPHVNEDGYICYTHEDSIVMDVDNPVGILRHCFDLAVQTLVNGLSGKNKEDFYNEFEAYWRQVDGIETLYTNIRLTDKVELVKYSKLKDAKGYFAAGDETELLNSYQNFFDISVHPVQYRNGLFFPVIAGEQFIIPEAGSKIGLDQLRQLTWGNNVPTEVARLNSLLEKTKSDDLVIFGLLRPNGLHSLFGVQLKNIHHRAHPLLPNGAITPVVPLSVKRLDSGYLLARGGTGVQFLYKKVLVIGGGSVGSAICDELVKAAIIKLTVVDKELLEVENCYRHSCGFRYIGKPKAEAIKLKLQHFYPHAAVQAIHSGIIDAINKKKISLKDYDSVVVATGNATLNQRLMRISRAEIPDIPVLFAWLDPLGIGGHCLVTNLPGKGCYQCLYSNEELHNIASFAHHSQPRSFSKNLTGCGSSYVPYGSLDANQTAILTVRQLIEVFNGEIEVNELKSWKGNAQLFVEQGFRLAERYRMTQEDLDGRKQLFHQSNCGICEDD